MTHLTNPLLLGVKMFLSEIRTWVNQYEEGYYVCSDFTREVVKKATEIGMRCGYVTISFKKNSICHAIVSFETDYGLIFIEPQTGEQIDIVIGKCYPLPLVGVSEYDYIENIDLEWNDGGHNSVVQRIVPSKVPEVFDIPESPNCMTCEHVKWKMKYDNFGKIIKSIRVCSKIQY